MKTTEELRKAHGTPREFADAVWRAVGEISIAEASAAIAKYQREYDEAVDQELKRNAS
jgi:hypothetical protein